MNKRLDKIIEALGRGAPPVRLRAASAATSAAVAWICGLADEDVCGHAPWAIDVERETIEAMQRAIMAALSQLPKEHVVALGRRLHELAEARDFEIDQLEKDYAGRILR